MRGTFSKLRALLRALLRQGLSPRRLAACLVIGAAFSIFPILGVATPLLTVVALGFKLNLPVIQLVNYLGTPVQLLLIVPFLRVGEWLLHAEPLPLAPAVILERLQQDASGFLVEFSHAAGCAIVGWAVAAVPAAVLLYAFLWRLIAARQRRALHA